MRKHFMQQADLMKMPSDYVEPIDESHDEFPASQLSPAGMKTLKIGLQNRYPITELNVIYAKKDELDLHLQIIVPAINDDKNHRFLLLMYVQGSAFHKQQLGSRLAPLEEMAKKGYVIAIVEYRHAPEHAFPVEVRDLNTATRFMLDHAFQYHVDPQSYIAWGDSSGGHTVSLAAVTEDRQFFSDEDIYVRPLHFRACIDFYGPTDISRMNKVPSTQDHVTAHSLEGEFFGSRNIYEYPELVQKANPINYINSHHKVPPFLIMHGNKDRLVPFEQSCLLYEALRKDDKTVDFYRLENSDHAGDAFFNPEVLTIVNNFIVDNLG